MEVKAPLLSLAAPGFIRAAAFYPFELMTHDICWKTHRQVPNPYRRNCSRSTSYMKSK